MWRNRLPQSTRHKVFLCTLTEQKPYREVGFFFVRMLSASRHKTKLLDFYRFLDPTRRFYSWSGYVAHRKENKGSESVFNICKDLIVKMLKVLICLVVSRKMSNFASEIKIYTIMANELTEYKYKVTYHSKEMGCSFVRIKDDAILFTNPKEDYVRMFAMGFCQAKNEKFYIE